MELTIAAATHLNAQVSRDVANIGLASPALSVRSVSSSASKLSEAGERLQTQRWWRQMLLLNTQDW